jgi:hypothetical protein
MLMLMLVIVLDLSPIDYEHDHEYEHERKKPEPLSRLGFPRIFTPPVPFRRISRSLSVTGG